jgi:hypothetical protein
MLARTLLAVALAASVIARPVAQQEVIPFDVCARSDTWQRPTPDVQATMWSNPRYAGLDVSNVPQWTHHFFASEPDSASLAYDASNLSGVWTDDVPKHCAYRGTDSSWVELWALGHHVVSILANRSKYAVTVRAGRGYEIVQFRRLAPEGVARVSIQFVSESGETLDVLSETQPTMFVHSPDDRKF